MDNDRAASNSSSGGYKCDDQRVDDLLKSGELPDIVSAFELLWAAREKSSVVLGDRIGRLLLAECAQHVDEQGGDEESKELLQLLNSPHVKAIVESYDGVVLEREEAKRSATEITTPTFSPEANQKSLVNGTGETSNGESGPLKLIGLNRVGNEALGLVLKDADGLNFPKITKIRGTDLN